VGGVDFKDAFGMSRLVPMFLLAVVVLLV